MTFVSRRYAVIGDSSASRAASHECIHRPELHRCRLEVPHPTAMPALDCLDPAEENAADSCAAGTLGNELLVVRDREQHGQVTPAAVDDRGPLGRATQHLREPALRLR